MTFTAETFGQLHAYRERLREERPGTYIAIGVALDQLLKSHPALFPARGADHA